MDVLTRLTTGTVGAVALRRLAVDSLVANAVIVITGALVRLTASGLGCPTWPRCTESSYVSHPELGLHGAIEFGNRLLTFGLIAVAVLTWLAARRYRENGAPRPDLRRLAALLALGIPVQAVIGGITVLTGLHPFLVALHLLVSMALISLSVLLIRRTRGLVARPARAAGVLAARAAFGLTWLTVVLGTVVTGSGPHPGDESAARTGYDPVLVTHLHGVAVYGLVAATAAAVILLRTRAAVALLAVELAQAVIGVVQYHTGLPVVLVVLHLTGAAIAMALATNLVLGVRPAAAQPADPPTHRPVMSQLS